MPIDYQTKQANKALFEALGHYPPFRGTRLSAIAQALKEGAQPNARSAREADGVGSRPLHAAARHAGIAEVQALLDAGAKPATQRPDGVAALHLAACSRSEEAPKIIDALVSAGAPTSPKDAKGATPLALALRSGRLEAARKLLDLGASVGELEGMDPSPLIEAICRLDEPVASFLLERGVKAEGPHNSSALVALMKSKSFHRWSGGQSSEVSQRALSMLDRLMAAGLDPKGSHATVGFGRESLLCAGLLNNAPDALLERLRALGCSVASPEDGNSWSGGPGALAQRGELDAMSRAFELGLDPNWADASGRGLLSWAMNSRDIRMHEMVDFLLAKGADPNRANEQGFTPLFEAALHECGGTPERLVRQLLEGGADPNSLQGKARAPILAAVLCRSELVGQQQHVPGRMSWEAAQALLDAGADPNIRLRGVPLLCLSPDYFAPRLIQKGADTEAAAAYFALSEDPQRVFSRWGVDKWTAAGMPVDHLLKAYPRALARCSDMARRRLEEEGALAYMEALSLKSAVSAVKGAQEASAPSPNSAPALRI